MISESQIVYGFVSLRQGKSRLCCKYHWISVLENFIAKLWIAKINLYVEGRIKSRQWQAEDGTTKYTTEIQVTEFTFLTTKKEVDGLKTSQNVETKSTNFEASSPAAPENDLPF